MPKILGKRKPLGTTVKYGNASENAEKTAIQASNAILTLLPKRPGYDTGEARKADPHSLLNHEDPVQGHSQGDPPMSGRRRTETAGFPNLLRFLQLFSLATSNSDP